MVHQQSYEALRALYKADELSPVAVAASALKHGKQINESLNAFALLDADQAMSAARASEQRWKNGTPLSDIDGMPITIKDGIAFRGWPSRKGSLVTSSDPMEENSVVAERLLAAGAVVLGKTRMPEFAWKGVTDSPGFGVTRNPLNPDLTPGGSSGGCVAAVAAGVVRVSVGSDAGGSVRIPAAFTGTFGLKPTFGRVPITPPASSFFDVAHYGPMAASVSDLAAVMAVISGPTARDWTSIGLEPVNFDANRTISGLRIGLLNPLRWDESAVVVKRAMDETYGYLWSNGFDMKTVDFDVKEASRLDAFFYSVGCLGPVNGVPKEKEKLLDPGLLQFVEPVRNTTLEEIQRATQQRDALARQLFSLFDEIDVLMLPTMPILPFEAGHDSPAGSKGKSWFDWNPYTPAFNLTHNPAISIPFWPEAGKLPVGLQFVANKCREDLLLGLAAWFERSDLTTKKH